MVRAVKLLSVGAVDRPPSDKLWLPETDPERLKVAVSPGIEEPSQALATISWVVAGVLVMVQVVVPAGRGSLTPPLVMARP